MDIDPSCAIIKGKGDIGDPLDLIHHTAQEPRLQYNKVAASSPITKEQSFKLKNSVKR